MKFKDIYFKTIEYFPSEISISDGKYIQDTDGFYFRNLSDAWNVAEPHAENEWQDLLIWTIFGYLHKKASEFYKSKKLEVMNLSIVIDIGDLEKDFLNNLREGGYEEMLKLYEG